MPTPINVGMIDYSGETTRTLVYFEDIQADGLNWPTLFAPATGKYDLVKIPLVLLSRLNLTKTNMSQAVDTSVGSLPADAMAQRELAIRFSYVDDVTAKKYRFDVPGPVDAVLQAGTDVIDLGQALIAAFVVVFEANCVSPDGNAVTMLGARLVGRRS